MGELNAWHHYEPLSPPRNSWPEGEGPVVDDDLAAWTCGRSCSAPHPFTYEGVEVMCAGPRKPL